MTYPFKPLVLLLFWNSSASCPFLSISWAEWNSSLNLFQLLKGLVKEILYCYHSEYRNWYTVHQYCKCTLWYCVCHSWGKHHPLTFTSRFLLLLAFNLHFQHFLFIYRDETTSSGVFIAWMVMWMRIGNFQQSDLTWWMGM